MIGCFCWFLFYFRVHREMYRSTKGRCNWLMRELMFSEDKFGFDESLAEEEDIIHSLSPYTTSNSKVWFINIWSWNTQKKELENFSPFVKYLQIIKIRFSNEQFFFSFICKTFACVTKFFLLLPHRQPQLTRVEQMCPCLMSQGICAMLEKVLLDIYGEMFLLQKNTFKLARNKFQNYSK